MFAEPLPLDLWLDRIETIARGELASTEHALRHAMHLLQLSPYALREAAGAMSIDEASFESLLDAGELDTAALHLVAAPTALEIDAAADVVTATINCPSLGHAITAQAAAVADAVLGAWSACMRELVLKGESQPAPQRVADDLSGQSRRATRH